MRDGQQLGREEDIVMRWRLPTAMQIFATMITVRYYDGRRGGEWHARHDRDVKIEQRMSWCQVRHVYWDSSLIDMNLPL